MWCNAFTFYVSIISFQVGSLPKIEYLIDKSTTLAYSEMMFTISLRIVNAVVPLPSEIPPQWFHVFDGHSVRLYQAANTIYLIHSSFFAFVVPKNWKKIKQKNKEKKKFIPHTFANQTTNTNKRIILCDTIY